MAKWDFRVARLPNGKAFRVEENVGQHEGATLTITLPGLYSTEAEARAEIKKLRAKYEKKNPRKRPTRKARRYASKKIAKLRREGYAPKQAVAAALSMARKAGYRSIPKRKKNPAGRPAVTGRITEAPHRRGVWMVWIQSPQGAGYLRQGFGWKSKKGAEAAARRAYPGIELIETNPAGRPLTPAGKHCVIAAVERATGDVGWFNGTHLQPSRDKAILYPSSLVAMREAKRLGIRKAGLTVVVVPAAWDAKRLRNELDGVKPNPLSRKEIAAAARKFETFTGHRATQVREVKMKIPKTGFLLGPVRDISYIATRDGETSVYRHEFKANSRPSLVAAVDGSTAILAGGRYRVTADRGIVDK